jgi:DNA-binding transcriptional LysR family regulator
MRQALGDPLFVRTAQGMLPTPRLEALLPTVQEVLSGLRLLHQAPAPFDPATAKRHFVVCMSDASHVTLLPQLLRHIRHLSPGSTLAAPRIDDSTAAALQTGQADLALGHLPWLEAGYFQQALFEQDWVCLAQTGHPRAGLDPTRRWDLAQYQAEAHIGIPRSTAQELLDEAVARLGIRRQRVLELPGFLGLAGIVASSDLIATLPRQIGETLAHLAGLQALPCPFDIPPFTVRQHWHARYHQDPANRWLRQVCSGLSGQGPGAPMGTV